MSDSAPLYAVVILLGGLFAIIVTAGFLVSLLTS